MEVDEMLGQLEIPAEHAHTPVHGEEGKFMHEWVKQHRLTRTLEVGLAEGSRFDFAFIDGNHLYDGIFIDFYFVDLMLQKNGYVLFHDAWMRGTQLVASFLRHNRADYRAVRIPIRNLIMFQKVGRDERNWDHFREFYTLRSLFVHPTVRWLLNRGYFRAKPN